jgi:hypothetical protein
LFVIYKYRNYFNEIYEIYANIVSYISIILCQSIRIEFLSLTYLHLNIYYNYDYNYFNDIFYTLHMPGKLIKASCLLSVYIYIYIYLSKSIVWMLLSIVNEVSLL